MCSNAEGKTTVRIRHCPLKYAGMAELGDASHLGCDVERRVGSSPSTRTIQIFKREDIDAMDDKQLKNLLKLAETIQEALY